MKLTLDDITRMVDLSAVRTDVEETEVNLLIEKAKKYRCIAVFVMPCYIPLIKKMLKNEPDINLGGVIGFPSGADSTATKISQTKELIKEGCDELDMVINVGKLRSKNYKEVKNEIKEIVDIADGLPVKVILEIAYLNKAEIKKGCELSIEAGATFVKTGTGWADHPTKIKDIKLIKSFVGEDIKIKAAGGIRSLDTLVKMYNLGVSRFGISLNSAINIFQEYLNRNK